MNRLLGMHRPVMKGTTVEALNDALDYLCGKYQPFGGTRACNDPS
jgi:hypothetical protein